MTSKLFISAITKFLLGVLLVGLLIFLPAGTFDYIQGWILMAILFVPMFGAGVVMMIKNPALLASRLDAKEDRKEQSVVVKLSGLMFLGGFIVAGLGVRFEWFMLSIPISVLGATMFLIAYVLYAEVLRENTYLSRTIKVQEGQKVVDTGLYGIVRHPMYSATVVLFLSMALVLGSLPSFVIMLVYIPLIVKRIKNEEKVLMQGLAGYDEYCMRVRYRLLPLVW